MTERSTRTRDAFRESVAQLTEVVRLIPPDAWGKPALGEWSVRELTAHVVRVVGGAITYASPGSPITLESAADYYVQAMSSPRIHEQIAERAREAVVDLGDDPLEALQAVAERTMTAIAERDGNAPIASPFGGLRLDDYLPTRTLEIVIHTMDIAEAVSVPYEPSPNALNATVTLLAEIAVIHGDGTALMLALSGRQALPAGFNVLG